MTFAFGHLVGGWLIGKGEEWLRQVKIPRWGWFLLLLGTILPDIDFLLDWTIGVESHRTLTHSVVFFIGVPLLLYLFLRWKKVQDAKRLTLLFALGIGMHLLLDMLTSPIGIPLFWPNLLHISTSGVQYFDPSAPSFLQASAPGLQKSLRLALLDMALGTIWIFYLWWRKRIEF